MKDTKFEVKVGERRQTKICQVLHVGNALKPPSSRTANHSAGPKAMMRPLKSPLVCRLSPTMRGKVVAKTGRSMTHSQDTESSCAAWRLESKRGFALCFELQSAANHRFATSCDCVDVLPFAQEKIIDCRRYRKHTLHPTDPARFEPSRKHCVQKAEAGVM